MKHKIKLIDYNFGDDYGVDVEVNGKRLFYDGTNTYNCLHEILTELGIDFNIEYVQEEEIRTVVKRKMKLVEDE